MRRNLIAAAAVAAVALTGAGLVATAGADTTSDKLTELSLAEPTGDHYVGVTTMHLVDEERADPWKPDEKRELMLSLWYPAEDERAKAAPYMANGESKLFVEQLKLDQPADMFSTVRTNATPNAEPDTDDGGRPLVVLSPGFTFPRATLTGLAEDLASRGYIVAAIGHNYEAPTTFPDGHTTGCDACDTPDKAKVVEGRVADTSFVLDTLLGKKSSWEGGNLIDSDRIAMGGHSIGGASSFDTMLADDRIDAGFNLDGTFAPVGEPELDRPFMIVGNAEHGVPGDDTTWTDAWSKLTGWKRWLSVKGTTHSSFTDLSPIADQIGQPIQELSGERCTTITRNYVSAFVDTHLRGEDEPILDGPTEDNPEVNFHNP